MFNDKAASVQIMAWRRRRASSLPEPKFTVLWRFMSSLTQWINISDSFTGETIIVLLLYVQNFITIRWSETEITMSVVASQLTSLTSVYWTVCSGADQRIHQSSVLLAFVRGFHRRPVNSPHKGPVTRKMFPFDDVILRNWATGHWTIDGQLFDFSRLFF